MSRNVIVLERGADELLLANTLGVAPLFVPSGREYVKKVIAAALRIGTGEGLRAAFPQDGPLIDLLFQHRILIPVPLQAADSADKARDIPFPRLRNAITLYLILTQSCNLGCRYCLNGARTRRKDRALFMNLETALRGVQMGLDRLTSGGVLEIAFFGGEPLLHWFRVRDVVHRCETDIGPRYPDRKIRYHITSNLAYLPPDLIGWARRHQVTFLCDVDGPAAVHDQCRPYKGGRPSHRDVVANVRRLADAGLKVSLRATLTALNQHHMMDIAQHHKEIGGCSSAFVPVCPVDSDEYTFPAAMLPSPEVVTEGLVQVYQSRVWDRETLFPFSAYSTKIKPGAFVVTGCGAPYGNTPVVDVDGRVFPCLYLMGTSEFLLGDVHHGNPLDAPCLEELFRRLHVDQVEGCRECAWRYVCGGGCPVWRLLVLSRTDADPAAKEYCRRINCHFTRKILETLLWDMAGEAVRRGAGTPIDTAPPNGESLYCV